jgi:hypothetical protein
MVVILLVLENRKEKLPWAKFSFFFLGGIGVWTQGFSLARAGTLLLKPCLQPYFLTLGSNSYSAGSFYFKDLFLFLYSPLLEIMSCFFSILQWWIIRFSCYIIIQSCIESYVIYFSPAIIIINGICILNHKIMQVHFSK